jgi:hypothetical protein
MFHITDGLAEKLGVSFKKRKDEGRDVAKQEGVWMGALVSTGSGEVTISLPKEKASRYQERLAEMCRKVGGGEETTLLDWQRLAGVLGHCCTLHRWGRNFMGSIYELLRVHREGGRITKDSYGDELREDLGYWEKLLGGETEWRGKTSWTGAVWDLVCRPADLQLGTDACLSKKFAGWGGAWGRERRAGKFTQEELAVHDNISLLELLAVEKILKEAHLSLRGKKVLLWTDNEATVSFLNRGTAHPVARRTMKSISLQLSTMEADLRAKHIPGALNVVNDQLSRGKLKASTTQWTVKREVFESITRGTVDYVMFSDDEGMAAKYLLPNKGDQDDTWYGTPTKSSLEAPGMDQMVGRTVWANPPWELVGEAIKVCEEVWARDPMNTRFFMLVPKYTDRWWWAKLNDNSRGKRSKFFRITSLFRQEDSIFAKTGCREFAETGVPVDCGRPSFETVLLTSPGVLLDGPG